MHVLGQRGLLLSPTNEAANGAVSDDCGLAVNPFRAAREYHDEAVGLEIVTHAAAAKVLTTARRSVDSGSYRPIWVDKGELVSDTYLIIALAEMLALGGPRGPLDLLFSYTPLPSMKTGRVRAALNGVAERLSGSSWPRTLGRCAAQALAQPDESLPEYAALRAGDLEAVSTRFAEDPEGACTDVFGPYLLDRTGSEDLEMLMRESSARMNALEKDPDAASETDAVEAENITLDDLVTGAAPMPLEDETGLAPIEAAPEEEKQRTYEDDVADYVVAYLREHLSPVLARAVAAYRQQGANAATQELKVTKAPRKTLAALGRFAKYGHSAVVLVFDQFGEWHRISQDMRLEITSSLMEMRWALEGSGVVIVMSAPGITPELEEQFAVADHLDWDMPELDGLTGDDPPVEGIPLQAWIDACTVCEPTVSADDPVFEIIRDRAQGSLKRFADIAAVACDDAMRRGSDHLDAAAISEEALAAAAAGGPEGEEGR